LFPPMDNTVDSMLETTDLEQQVLEVVWLKLFISDESLQSL
jgi:hypothetical protein